MRNSLGILLTIGLLVFWQQRVNAQVNQDHQFLYQVGVPDSLFSSTLEEFRKIYVRLPPGYDPKKKLKYPVVYILDGEVFLPTVSDVQNYYSGGFMPEMVLVGISNEKNRTRDLTPSAITSKYGMPFTEESGEGAQFCKFLAEELVPFIENKYPVTSFRTLIGHSYGGLFAIYTLLKHPQLFANYLAIDPSLDWDGQKIVNEAKDMLPALDYEGRSLYVSLSGQLHLQDAQVTIDNVMLDTTSFTLFPRANLSFANTVKQNPQNGLFFEWKFYPNDLHGTIPFPSIKDGLISLFQWYQMENTASINSFETTKEELQSIVKYRANKLADHFGYLEPPYEEDILSMLGHMNLDMGQAEKAKMYFEFAIEYYPASASAYAAMADYYEAQNDLTNALKNVVRAFEISGSDEYRQRIVALEKRK